MQHYATRNPPMPSDEYESARVNETRLRRRLLEGAWKEDLRDRMRRQVGLLRADAWGEPSLAVNFFGSLVRELATLYDAPYQVTHDQASPEQTEAIINMMRLGGLFGLMPDFQRMTLGLREMLIRVSSPAPGKLRFRAVTPDMVRARATADDPSIPIEVQEYRRRVVPSIGRDPIWTVDHLSIANLDAPEYRVFALNEAGDLGRDVTAEVLGAEFSGEAYPYRRKPRDGEQIGRPVLPYVLYHASGKRDRLFDPFADHEIVDGTLDLAVLHQMLMHVFKDASWPQRYAVNLEVQGAGVIETADGRRAEVVTDPATVLMLATPRDEEGLPQPMVGQWQAGGDVDKMESTISNIGARMATDAGIPPSDVQRLGGTARSGAAISLTNEGKRKAQRKYGAIFSDYDERLVALCAVLHNSAHGTAFVEGGYTVVYQQMPLSPEELKARREEITEMLDRKLIGPVDAYMRLHPGTTATEAARKIAEASGEDPAAPDIVADVSDAVDELAALLEDLPTDSPARDDVVEIIASLRSAIEGRAE